jgi:hypothetical protein
MADMAQGLDYGLDQTSSQAQVDLNNLLRAILVEQKITNFLLQEGMTVEKRDLSFLRQEFTNTNSY